MMLRSCMSQMTHGSRNNSSIKIELLWKYVRTKITPSGLRRHGKPTPSILSLFFNDPDQYHDSVVDIAAYWASKTLRA